MEQPSESLKPDQTAESVSSEQATKAVLAEQVYEEILYRLLSSQLGPGARITIDALSRELGLSQTPIREALHRLEADGVVNRTHLAGYRVAPTLNRKQFEDLVEIRLLLEPAAARLAAERIEHQALDEIRGLATRMSELDLSEDTQRAFASFCRLDGAFHDAIASGTGSKLIREAIVRLHTQVHIFRLGSQSAITTEALTEHGHILEAIASREPDKAAYLMRRHIEQSAERFRSSFEV